MGGAVADAGKHVLCEKPLALTVADVDRMAEAAKRNGVIVQEAIMMRFHPQIEFVRDLLANGTIGEVRRRTRAVYVYAGTRGRHSL